MQVAKNTAGLRYKIVSDKAAVIFAPPWAYTGDHDLISVFNNQLTRH